MCRKDLTVRIADCRHAAKIPKCDTATRHVQRHLSSMTGMPDSSRGILPRSGRFFQGIAHIDAAGRPVADCDCSEAAGWQLMLGPGPRLEPKLEPGLATGTGVSGGSSCMRVRQAVSSWMD